MRTGETDGAGNLDQGRIDAANSCVGVAQNGKKRVGGERNDGDARGALAKPRQREQAVIDALERFDFQDGGDQALALRGG